MKKRGIIHPQLCEALARLGHKDTFVIADAGLPIPEGCVRIDLGYVLGEPSFETVAAVILDEIVVESTVIARESDEGEAAAFLGALFPEARKVSHEEFKKSVASAKFVVRTGSTVPYANVIMTAGVPF